MTATKQDTTALVEGLLARRKDMGAGDAFERVWTFPERAGRFVPWDEAPLTARVREVLRRTYPGGLYRHQAQAIQALLGEQRDVVVATATASGKSLIYQSAVSEVLDTSDTDTVLILVPQRALANDQLHKLHGLLPELLGERWDPRLVARYDGTTPREERQQIRPKVRVLLTNPDMLHVGILAHHGRLWQRLLNNLRYVILDEAHEYRGTFGSNVAMLLQRLQLICRRGGAQPRFVATSATIADPAAHLERLTGRSFALVGPQEDGSAQARKEFWIAQPGEHPFELAKWLMRELVLEGASALCFCQSRQTAERLTRDVSARKLGDKFAVYRSGLSAEERERVEVGLREGTLRGVFSTSALELGVDIGSLDVCLCIGFPNTTMSLWQRAGRVGRGDRPGVVILIPEQRPMDAYYAEHPEALFERSSEPLAINMNSRPLATWHYACALHEADRDMDRVPPEQLGWPMQRIAEEHRAGQEDPSFYGEPHGNYNLRAGGDRTYTLVVDGEDVGEISRTHLLRETPPDAIYLHGGRTFRVVSVNEAPRYQVRLRHERTPHWTRAYVHSSVKLQQCWSVAKAPGVRVEQGRLRVSQTLVSLTEYDMDGDTVRVQQGSCGLKSNLFPTTGVALHLEAPDELTPQFELGWNGLRGLLQGLLPAVLGPCDLSDYAVHLDRQGSEARVVIYDTAYEGIDLSLQLFDRWPTLLEAAAQLARDCGCNLPQGCFRCVRDAYADAPTDPEATVALIEAIRDLFAQELSVSETTVDRVAKIEETTACPTCEAQVSEGHKFCANCGTKLEG